MFICINVKVKIDKKYGKWHVAYFIDSGKKVSDHMS